MQYRFVIKKHNGGEYHGLSDEQYPNIWTREPAHTPDYIPSGISAYERGDDISADIDADNCTMIIKQEGKRGNHRYNRELYNGVLKLGKICTFADYSELYLEEYINPETTYKEAEAEVLREKQKLYKEIIAGVAVALIILCWDIPGFMAFLACLLFI